MVLTYFAKKGANCIGIDHSKNALKLAKFVAKESKVKIKLMKTDIFSLPFRDNSFDLVFNTGVFEHFSEKKQIALIKEMTRVSRKYVLINIPNMGKSSIFTMFIHSHGNEKKSYHVPHKTTNIKKIAKLTDLKLVYFDGLHIFSLKDFKTFRTYGKALERFYSELKRTMSGTDRKMLKNFPNMEIIMKNVPAFIRLEEKAKKSERIKFAFTHIFLFEKAM
jgi:2-polyprenyl-3-methyl-5-hydroxy-6-metoxy-1,4-benzoquinol methylase